MSEYVREMTEEEKAMQARIEELEIQLESTRNRLEAYTALIIRLAAHLERIEL